MSAVVVAAVTAGSAIVVGGCASGSAPATPDAEATAGPNGAAVSAPVPDTAPGERSAIARSSTTIATTAVPGASDRFAATDRSLQSRIGTAGLGGGVVLVVRDGRVIHEHAIGDVGTATPLSVASAAKWLTAATLMTYVDDGTVGLDDPVSRWLPEFADEQPPVTVRELLDHTSGVRDEACLWNPDGRLGDCVGRVARSPREFPAGTKFSYGNADFHVIGRVLEVVGGADFATVFQRRLGGPVGMPSTSWPGAPNNPSPAAGAQTTVDDYARFLTMILGRGTLDGRQILSENAVGELVRNQVGGYDTSHDYSVGITGIPRYSLGSWPDVVDPSGATVVVSGNGGKGFYPWVDFSTNSYGIIGVQDDRGAQLAVPASQKVAVQARNDLGE